jgi:hypothetical protein
MFSQSFGFKTLQDQCVQNEPIYHQDATSDSKFEQAITTSVCGKVNLHIKDRPKHQNDDEIVNEQQKLIFLLFQDFLVYNALAYWT